MAHLAGDTTRGSRRIFFFLFAIGLAGVMLRAFSKTLAAFVTPEYLGTASGITILALVSAGTVWALRKFGGGVQDLFRLPLVRGLGIAAVLTAVYAGIAWIIYRGPLADYLTSQGVNPMTIIAVLTVICIPTLPRAVWKLYGPTGIPGDSKTIGRAAGIVAVATVLFLLWWNYERPNNFFDFQTGESVAWVAEKEGRVYHAPGFSPKTGEELRPITPEDAEKYRSDGVLKETLELMDKVGKGLPTCPDTAHATWAMGEVPARLNCASGWIPIPRNVGHKIDVAGWAELETPDGKIHRFDQSSDWVPWGYPTHFRVRRGEGSLFLSLG